MEVGKLVTELAQRLSGKAVISSDVSDDDIKAIGIEALTAQALAFFEGSTGLNILDSKTIKRILALQKETKSPLQVEVIRESNFAPSSRETEPDFIIRNADLEKTPAGPEDFASYFNDRLEKLKAVIERGRVGSIGLVNKMESLKQYANGREVGIIGMVYEKLITKKGHILITLEDETGTSKILFIRPEKTSRKELHELFDSASKIVNDEVIAVRGRISSPFIIATAVLWPDIPIRQAKRTEEEIVIAFASDIHVGSKLFLERQFAKFIEWLNGKVEARRELAEKVKYLVISGDLVDGIGVYPNQDKELSISDIYRQYTVLFDYLAKIPDYIEVFALAGNHDAMQRAEPQPPLAKELVSDFSIPNIHLVSNPSYITLNGIKVLAYHGTSLDSMIQAIPGCSYSKPQGVMIEVLRKRHVSPIYGDNPIMPSRKDSLVIDEIPDILHMGHLHKNGYAEYHGTQVINSGTWQSRTSYQVKLGHMPTPAILPVYNTKSGELWNVDFNAV